MIVVENSPSSPSSQLPPPLRGLYYSLGYGFEMKKIRELLEARIGVPIRIDGSYLLNTFFSPREMPEEFPSSFEWQDPYDFVVIVNPFNRKDANKLVEYIRFVNQLHDASHMVPIHYIGPEYETEEMIAQDLARKLSPSVPPTAPLKS